MKQKKQLPFYELGTDKSQVFEITSLLDLRKRDGDWPSTLPHRHTFYEILYITGGQGRHYIDFEPYSLTKNTLYFISPGQVHFWQLEKPPEGYALLFTKDFLWFSLTNDNIINDLTYFQGFDVVSELHLKNEQIASIKSIVRSIETEYSALHFKRSSVLQAYMQILLIQIQRIYNLSNAQHCSSPELTLAHRFKQLVSKKYDKETSIQAYADCLNVSVGHLSNIVKAMTGHSPGQIIRQEIILNAKRLLSHTNLTVAEIAYKLNFEDPSYFGRFFKRETQISPIRFRCDIREKCHFLLE